MITASRRNDTHRYMLLEAADIVPAAEKHSKWMHHQMKIHDVISHENFLRRASTGDESLVQMSDSFLESIEDQVPMSRGWRVVDDVVGGVPNVPAFLAGHPQHMRRRMRVSRDDAPITIFMDLTSSMGINKSDVLKRGVTLLALTRLLVEHRPVELWVGSSLDDRGQCGTVAWRIDTAPLDLARAAFHIADVSMSRLFGYAMCESMFNRHLGGYGVGYEQTMSELREIAGWHDIMLIPQITYHDPLVSDSVGWIRRIMSRYLSHSEEAA